MRTAYNIIIYEALDFTTGLFTPRGRDDLDRHRPADVHPRHGGDGEGQDQAFRRRTTSSRATSTSPTIPISPAAISTTSRFTLPIFHKGKLVGFSCCMAHWLDVGGMLGGMTHRHLFRRTADPDPEVSGPRRGQSGPGRHHPQNVRLPSRAMGDLRAQVTAVKTGERRFLAAARPLRPRRGARLDRRDHGPRRGGGARAHAHHPGRRLRGRVLHGRRRHRHRQARADPGAVIVKGDEMTIDLTEVSKQVRGFYNSGITTGYACAQVAYKCLTSPTDYPINDGSFRSLKVIVPPGRVISAVRPAPMRWWMTYPDDHRRHDLQGAGAGDPGSRHRRPSRRSAGVVASTASTRRRRSSSSAASGRSAAAGAPR